MYIIDGYFPYECKKISGKELRKNFIHTVVCEFPSSNIDKEEELLKIYDVIKKDCFEKYVWALYGSDNQDNWICLQVASRDSDDVISEIIYDISCMKKNNSYKKKTWRSKFHANVFEANYEYIATDIVQQKYQLMKEKFDNLMIVIIESECFLNDGEVGNLVGRNKYAEVKYACATEPLFWNAFGKEHTIVKQFANQNL